MDKKGHLLILLVLPLLFLGGCGTQTAPTDMPVPSLPPTTTPRPVPSPTATPLPIPSPTPLPSPTATPQPPPRQPIFGTQMNQVDAAHGLDLALQAGVHWLRLAAFPWDRIEPDRTDPPTYRWDVVDEASLRQAAEAGFQIIAIVQFTPDWAQKVPGTTCGPIREESLAAFGQFLQALVSRYGATPYNVRYWELGNEPDVDPGLVRPRSVFGCWGDQADEYYGGRYYAQMLKVAYPAIKSVDPQAQVLIGGLLLDRPSGGQDSSPRFLEGVLEAGGGDYFDMVSFHAYSYYGGTPGLMGNQKWPGSPTVMPAKVAFLREVLARYGYADKPLINTEAALLCRQASADCLEMQAAYLPRVYAEALALGLEGQVYYAWINENWNHVGLILPDLTPKPVYRAYQTAAFFLTAVRYQGRATGYPPEFEGYTFRRDDDSGFIDVLWSADGGAYGLPLPPGATAFDRYGVPIAGPDRVVVDFNPVYVTR